MRILTVFILLLNACAYNISSARKHVPGGYEHAYLAPFYNRTKLPGIEAYFTNSLSRELQRSEVAKITDKNNSQVTIEGTINNLSFAPTAPETNKNLVQLQSDVTLFLEYRIYIEASVAVRRNSDNQIIWSGSFKGEKSYVAPQVGSAGVNTVNPLYNHSARHLQISQVAQDMMVEAVDRMTEQF